MKIIALALLVAASAWSIALAGEPHLPVGDPAYERLERLAALGLINDGLLNARPLGREAMAAMVHEARERATGLSDPWIESDLRAVELRLASLGSWRDPVTDARYASGDGGPVPVGLERRGDRLESGGNARLGVEVGATIRSWLAVGYQPEIRYPVGPENDLDVATRSAYAVLEGWGLALTAGRESLWWGPGFRGSLLLTDNAPPFDLLRIEAAQPWRVPWIGPMSAHVFVTRLEAGYADIPNPYLAGVRLAFRPHPLLEFGLARTALFGGEGRPVDAGLLWDVIRARGENNPGNNPGNQLAAADITVRIPWKVQPLTVYGELGGEDEANGLPSHPGSVIGLYLPTVLNRPQWEVRAEWADNTWAHVPGIWYQHSLYPYRYKGFVIGHPMGTDARMLSGELAYRPTTSVRVSLLYDEFQDEVFGPAERSARSPGAKIDYQRGPDTVAVQYRYFREEDPASASTSGHTVDLTYQRVW